MQPIDASIKKELVGKYALVYLFCVFRWRKRLYFNVKAALWMKAIACTECIHSLVRHGHG
jgi:hypothetical protein